MTGASATARRPDPPVRSSGPSRRSGPALSLVASRPAPAGRVLFALVLGGVLAAGLVGLLMLHTLAAQDAFTVHALARQVATLGEQEQQLSLTDQQLGSPLALAADAHRLGMLPTGKLTFIHRAGRVVALAHPAPPPAPPVPAKATKNAKPTAHPTATPTAHPTATPSPRPSSRPSTHTTKRGHH